jgi:hypothetical protein
MATSVSPCLQLLIGLGELEALGLDHGDDVKVLDDVDGELAESRGRGLHSPTFRLNVSTFRGMLWVCGRAQ